MLFRSLRALSGLHRGLLALARRMEVRTAAIAGETPPDMTHEELGGLQRIEIGDIPAALASARSEPVNRDGSFDESAGSAALPEAPQASAADQPAPELEPAPAPEPVSAPVPSEVPLPEEKRVVLTPRSGKPKTLTGLLTAEELASLLEDEQ